MAVQKQKKKVSIDHRHEYYKSFFGNSILVPARFYYIGTPPANPEEAYVENQMASDLIRALEVFKYEDPKAPVTLMINTLGGDEFSMYAMYDAIRAVPFKVTMIATGACMSAGTIIIQAADERLITPTSTFMIHDGYLFEGGHARNVEKWIDFWKKDRHRMYEIYASRSGKPASYWETRIDHDVILNAYEAVAEGLVDRVIEPSKGSFLRKP
jgi:ATP-dependent Clp protease protease subunit